GLFLLARPLLDLGFPALARQAGVPLPALLAGLAACVFGEHARLGDRIDPAVAVWATLDPETPANELSSIVATIPPEHLQWLQSALRGLRVGQRHLGSSVMALASITTGDHRWFVATDPKGLCWPLSLPGTASTAVMTQSLIKAWGDATGETSELVPCEKDPTA